MLFHREDVMAEKIVAARTRAEKPAETQLAAWFTEQEGKSLDRLEAGATAITQLVTALYAVAFTVLSLGGNPPPVYLQHPLVKVGGLLITVCWLISLVAALSALIPKEYHYSRRSMLQLRD